MLSLKAVFKGKLKRQTFALAISEDIQKFEIFLQYRNKFLFEAKFLAFILRTGITSEK